MKITINVAESGSGSTARVVVKGLTEGQRHLVGITASCTSSPALAAQRCALKARLHPKTYDLRQERRLINWFGITLKSIAHRSQPMGRSVFTASWPDIVPLHSFLCAPPLPPV